MNQGARDHQPSLHAAGEATGQAVADVEQADFFAFIGPGEFCLYVWDARPDSPTSGNMQKLLVGESNPGRARRRPA